MPQTRTCELRRGKKGRKLQHELADSSRCEGEGRILRRGKRAPWKLRRVIKGGSFGAPNSHKCSARATTNLTRCLQAGWVRGCSSALIKTLGSYGVHMGNRLWGGLNHDAVAVASLFPKRSAVDGGMSSAHLGDSRDINFYTQMIQWGMTTWVRTNDI